MEHTGRRLDDFRTPLHGKCFSERLAADGQAGDQRGHKQVYIKLGSGCMTQDHARRDDGGR